MSDSRERWPQWLRDADTRCAHVDITPNGRVIWHSGEWRGGKWRGGVWHSGEWRGGEWCGGEWRGGVWRDGEWRGGVWRGGVWRGGEWRGGVWYGGEWHSGGWCNGVWRDGEWYGGVWRGGVWCGGEWRGGMSVASRAEWVALSDGVTVRFGCLRLTWEEWDAFLAGDDTVIPDGTLHDIPPRDSEGFRLLRASYEAQRAYWTVLRGEG